MMKIRLIKSRTFSKRLIKKMNFCNNQKKIYVTSLVKKENIIKINMKKKKNVNKLKKYKVNQMKIQIF